MHRMLRIVLVGTATAFVALGSASADTQVKGHYKKDGTYVPPHTRTDPNSSKSDNWSTKGNTNPYTGKKGTKDPYK